MATRKSKKKVKNDPVENSPAVIADQESEMTSMDVNKTVQAKTPQQEIDEDDNWISIDDLKSINESKVRTPHPFDSYPLAKEVVMGKDDKGNDVGISKTYIIVLNPTFDTVSDPSNDRVTVFKSKFPGMGGKPGEADAKEAIVRFKTSHTRCVPDRFNVNHTLVFDRDIVIGRGASQRTYQCCIIPEHSLRAQVMFYYDHKRDKVRPDKRYQLLDIKQQNRLLRMYRALHYQQTRAEVKAREFDKTPETTKADSD